MIDSQIIEVLLGTSMDTGKVEMNTWAGEILLAIFFILPTWTVFETITQLSIWDTVAMWAVEHAWAFHDFCKRN